MYKYGQPDELFAQFLTEERELFIRLDGVCSNAGADELYKTDIKNQNYVLEAYETHNKLWN